MGGATGTRACRDRRKMTIGQYFSIVSLLAEKVRLVKFCDRPDLFCACRAVPVHPCTEIDLAHRVLTHAASIGEVGMLSICTPMALPSEVNREFHVIAPEVSQRTSQPVANQCCVSISYISSFLRVFMRKLSSRHKLMAKLSVFSTVHASCTQLARPPMPIPLFNIILTQ